MDQNPFPAPVPCVIPAAGLSSRMGAWKPFLPWKDGVVADAVVSAALSAGCLPVLVAGCEAARLEERYGGRPDLLVVRNDQWRAGMLGSIRTGAAAAGTSIPEGIRSGFLVLPADMPLVEAATLRDVMLAARRRAERRLSPAALFASSGGRLGHPVWIPYAFLPAIMELDPGARLRDWLTAGPWEPVPVPGESIFIDLDTPEEYRAALASVSGNS